MRRILIILFLLFDMVCFGQTSKKDFILKIDFFPSFISPSTFTIRSKQDTSSIEFIVKKGLYINKQTKNAESEIEAITTFLKTYQFKIQELRDTTGEHKVFINGDTLTLIPGPIYTDGATIQGTFTQENIVKTFRFWTPLKPENEKLLKLIFSLLHQSITEEKEVNYIVKLEGELL